MAAPTLLIGAATRPYPGETVSGDAWQLSGEDGRHRLTLVDGLGHGPEAAFAAQRALATLAAHPALGPADSLGACHRALVGTRGAAISVVAVDLIAAELRFAGIGNVEAQLWRSGRVERPMAYRGIVGAAMRTLRELVYPLEEEWVLVMHSDGIRGRFDLPALPAFRQRDMQGLATAILADWGRVHDDATVIAVRPAPRPAPDCPPPPGPGRHGRGRQRPGRRATDVPVRHPLLGGRGVRHAHPAREPPWTAWLRAYSETGKLCWCGELLGVGDGADAAVGVE